MGRGSRACLLEEDRGPSQDGLPQIPLPSHTPTPVRLRGDGGGMSLGTLSPAVLELPLVVGNRDAASGCGDGPVPSEGTFVAM